MIARKMSPTNLQKNIRNEQIVRRMEHNDTPAIMNTGPLIDETLSVEEQLRRLQNGSNNLVNVRRGESFMESINKSNSRFSPENKKRSSPYGDKREGNGFSSTQRSSAIRLKYMPPPPKKSSRGSPEKKSYSPYSKPKQFSS